jgi:EAL domain-containing protein (putative c-di-GMP-specific phosphodiesterase class I)
MRFLIGAGCEQAQGGYFSRPVPVARAAELLREGRIEPGAASLRKVGSSVA